MNDPLHDAVRLVFGRFVSRSKIEALRRELQAPNAREEMLVSAVPLAIQIDRGPQLGELHIMVEGFDPITAAPGQSIIVRREGHSVVIEREGLREVREKKAMRVPRRSVWVASPAAPVPWPP